MGGGRGRGWRIEDSAGMRGEMNANAPESGKFGNLREVCRFRWGILGAGHRNTSFRIAVFGVGMGRKNRKGGAARCAIW